MIKTEHTPKDTRPIGLRRKDALIAAREGLGREDLMVSLNIPADMAWEIVKAAKEEKDRKCNEK